MSPPRSPKLAVLVLALTSTLLAWGLSGAAPAATSRVAAPLRIVSLAPAITDTLLTIGAKSQLVGASDYCRAAVPRVGTSLLPAYERIAHLRPTLILADRSSGTRQQELAVLAPTETVAWHTLDEVEQGVRRIGTLTGRVAAATELATRLRTRLGRPPPPDGPRVLLVHDVSPVDSGEVWFIQRGSLHGSVLEAAGARNAVPDTPSGGPRLGLEELVALDPDLVIVLTTSDHDHTADGFRSLHGLRAARQQRIGVVRGPAVFATGPSVLDLVTQLEHEVHRLR